MSDLVSRLRDYPVGLAIEAANEIEALRTANEAFGKRQEWWTETMFTLEAERDRLRGHFEDATADYRRDREADTALMRQALEALEYYQHRNIEWEYSDAYVVAALRERLGEKT